jgi:hypothetical protein
MLILVQFKSKKLIKKVIDVFNLFKKVSKKGQRNDSSCCRVEIKEIQPKEAEKELCCKEEGCC